VSNEWLDRHIRRKGPLGAEYPRWGGWGGRCEFYTPRMDWTIKPYAKANHPPVARLGHAAELRARPGDRVDLSAEGSSDPDGDALSYEWFCYAEAGSLGLSSASLLPRCVPKARGLARA
jgi:hypothetical protein